jgi:hypothetical protein
MYNEYRLCTHGEMDITTVFGTVIGGSNPSGCTKSVYIQDLRSVPENQKLPILKPKK